MLRAPFLTSCAASVSTARRIELRVAERSFDGDADDLLLRLRLPEPDQRRRGSDGHLRFEHERFIDEADRAVSADGHLADLHLDSLVVNPLIDDAEVNRLLRIVDQRRVAPGSQWRQLSAQDRLELPIQ